MEAGLLKEKFGKGGGLKRMMSQFDELAINEDILLASSDLEDEDVVVDRPLDEIKRVRRVRFEDIELEKGPFHVKAESIPGRSKESAGGWNGNSVQDTEDMKLYNTKIFKPTKVTLKSVERVLTQLEAIYETERSVIVSKSGYISTPLHSLKELARKCEETVHNEVTYIPNYEGKTLVRVELIVGAFRGVGEAFIKRLATQMAAIDVLLKVGETGDPIFKPIPYAIYPGWRIPPQVCDDLFDFCQKNRLKSPVFYTSSNTDDFSMPLYSVECLLGENTIALGVGDLFHVAKKLAAYGAFEVITGMKYAQEYVAFGSACTTYAEFVEMGFNPVMSDIKKKWMLEDTTCASETIRGIDQTELNILRKQQMREEIRQIADKTKKIEITVKSGLKSMKGLRLVRFG